MVVSLGVERTKTNGVFSQQVFHLNALQGHSDPLVLV